MKRILMSFVIVFCTLFSNAVLSQTKEEELQLDINEKVKEVIDKSNSTLEEMKASICSQVANMSKKAQATNLNGTMQYNNWVQFVKLGQGIEELNDQWNELYAQMLENIIAEIKASNACSNCGNFKDERADDLLADEIEEKYLKYPADIASICFEEMHNFRSLRNCMNDADDTYSNGRDGSFDAGQTPSNQQEFDDEEFWTLINCNKDFTILNNVIDNSVFTDGEDDTQKKDIITVIKDILGIIGQTVGIVNTLADLMKDCAGTSKAHDRNMRSRFDFDNETRQFGYVMVQKGVLIDFQQTVTKIKGKIQLWKLNKRSKWRKDRKTKATLDFCALEWDGCKSLEWPIDGSPYIHPKAVPRVKKNKIKYFHPSALQIQKSTHFLQFHFGYKQNYIFITGFNLLGGSKGCGPTSNLGWN